MGKVRHIIMLIIIAGMMLVFTSCQPINEIPTKEGLTELYFENQTNLPNVIKNDLFFSFTIHNLENREYTYAPQIRIEFPETQIENISIEMEPVVLQHDEQKTFKRSVIFTNPFRTGKIWVMLPSKNQEISFIVKNLGTTLDYAGYGNMRTDCINTTFYINATDKMIITAKGNYGRGWPTIGVYINGKMTNKINVNNYLWKEYTVPFNFTNDYLIDLAFINDYYNTSTFIDRNLYISNVSFDDKTIQFREVIIDQGFGETSFDCEKIKTDYGMYSNGAMRFRVMVSP